MPPALEKSGKPEALDTDLIGTGPFQMVQYQKDMLVRFRAFKDFWGTAGGQAGRAAKVDNLVFSVTPNPAVRYAKLRTNECQIARYPNPADLAAIRANPALRLQSADTTTINYIYFRTDQKPFDDERVRLALAMAIDMPDLVADVFQGGGRAAAALVPPALWGHDAALQPYGYDPAKAQAVAVGRRLSERVQHGAVGHPGGASLYAQRPARVGDDPGGLGEDRREGADRYI